jgi:hypothetical protein
MVEDFIASSKSSSIHVEFKDILTSSNDKKISEVICYYEGKADEELTLTVDFKKSNINLANLSLDPEVLSKGQQKGKKGMTWEGNIEFTIK